MATSYRTKTQHVRRANGALVINPHTKERIGGALSAAGALVEKAKDHKIITLGGLAAVAAIGVTAEISINAHARPGREQAALVRQFNATPRSVSSGVFTLAEGVIIRQSPEWPNIGVDGDPSATHNNVAGQVPAGKKLEVSHPVIGPNGWVEFLDPKGNLVFTNVGSLASQKSDNGQYSAIYHPEKNSVTDAYTFKFDGNGFAPTEIDKNYPAIQAAQVGTSALVSNEAALQ